MISSKYKDMGEKLLKSYQPFLDNEPFPRNSADDMDDIFYRSIEYEEKSKYYESLAKSRIKIIFISKRKLNDILKNLE